MPTFYMKALWLLFSFLALLKPPLVSAGTVLIGLQIANDDSILESNKNDLDNYFIEAIHTLQSAMYFFSERKHTVTAFACMEQNLTWLVRTTGITNLIAAGIPFFTSTGTISDLCTLNHPGLHHHDAVMHINFLEMSNFFSFSEPDHYSARFFTVSTAHVAEANELIRILIHSLGNKSSVTLSTILIDQLKRERFSLLKFLASCDVPLLADTKGKPNYPYPLFTPAASTYWDRSGECSLIWPRNGTEIYSLSNDFEYVNLWENWVLDCDINPEPSGDFSLRFIDHRVHPLYSRLRFKGSDFSNSGELIMPYVVKIWGEDGHGRLSLTVSLTSDSEEEVVSIASFTVWFHIVHISALPAPTMTSLSPMIAQAPTRYRLGSFFNGLGLVGSMIEVGFNGTIFTEHFLHQWEGKSYLSVTDFNITEQLSPWLRSSNIFTHMRGHSMEVTAYVVDLTVDVVCIHEVKYHELLLEMQLWWQKLRSGGIMFGRNYPLPYDKTNEFIKTRHSTGPAVDEFALQLNAVHFNTRDGTWYIIKPEH